ncbi:hypothetical protein EGW08_022922, partial [Elysia chlorotica]
FKFTLIFKVFSSGDIPTNSITQVSLEAYHRLKNLSIPSQYTDRGFISSWSQLTEVLRFISSYGVNAQDDGILVQPDVIVPGLTHALTVTCSLPSYQVNSVETLLVLQISKEVSGVPTPVATLVPGVGATLEDTGAISDRAQVESTYDPTNMTSVSLSVIYNLVTADDAGTYLCSASVLNKLHLLSKSEFSATVTVKPLGSLNVFDLATTLAQVANTVGNLERILKAELSKRSLLESEVEKLTQKLANMSSNEPTSTAPTMVNPLCDACVDSATNLTIYENSTNERLSQLEHSLVTMGDQISVLEQQQHDPTALLGNESAAFCSQVEDVCVSVIRARSDLATTIAPTTAAPPTLVSENFELQTQVNIGTLPDYPVVSDIDLSSLAISRSPAESCSGYRLV